MEELKLLFFPLLIGVFPAIAQNKPIEVGFDISLMRVKPNIYSATSDKINSRFGGNVGCRINKHYTVRIGFYNESWGNRVRPMNWWSIPVLNELYVWKRRMKFIAAPNILLSKLYNDVSLMGGMGYNLSFSNYGLVKIEALYQSNKIEFFGRSKTKSYSNILMLNVGIQYIL